MTSNEIKPTILRFDMHRFVIFLFLFCISIELSLVLLDVVVNRWRWSESGAIRRLFNTTREDGLASWFAVTQTFVVALISWFIFILINNQNGQGYRRSGWLLIALFFSYMAVDDGAAVHERIGTAFSDIKTSTSFPSYVWQILFVPVFALIGLVIFVFLWKELSTMTQRIKMILAFACFALAVGMDFVEGLDNGYAWLESAYSWSSRSIRHYSKSIEEFLEMLGMSLFLITLLIHVPRLSSNIQVNFTNKTDSIS